MTLVIGARCNDGVVIMTDLKVTSRVSGYIEVRGLQSKISGVFLNIIFGYTGDVDVNDVFIKYSLGDYIVKRDDPDNAYTASNFIENLSVNITKLREILSRNNRSILLRLLVARQLLIYLIFSN
jgi:20S proteasome alpha/beta subunit